VSLLRKKDRAGDVSDPAKLLIIDHEKVERIFTQLEEAESNAQRASLAAQLTSELTRHTELEEQILYPFVRANVEDGPSMVDEANHEHGEAKQLIGRLEAMDATAPEFMGMVTALKKVVEHHVKEEEKTLFPKLESSVSAERLAYLRGELERSKFASTVRDLPEED